MNPIVILYAKCFLALALGFTVYIMTKFNEVKALHTTANETLTFKAFLSATITSQVISAACVIIWMLILPDLIKEYPKVKDSIYIANIIHIGGCALIGYANSSIVLKIFGAGTKYIMDTIDKKTNIADGK
jgi:hypothetical protein